MARRWKIELTIDGATLDHYIHDDGKWEWDPATPTLNPDEIADLVSRLSRARLQFERLGWTQAEIRRLP